jgi:hypothetical protein
MKKVIKRIEEDIRYEMKYAKERKTDLDARSWGWEQGILISINEARELVDIVKKYYSLTESKLKRVIDENRKQSLL